ncbi:MAG: leucyl aminopeptidase [Chlorobiota bacterium]
MVAVELRRKRWQQVEADAVVLFVTEEGAQSLEQEIGSYVPTVRVALQSGDISGKAKSVVLLYTDTALLQAPRVLIAGLGSEATLSAETVRRAAAAAAKRAASAKLRHVAIPVPQGSIGSLSAEEFLQAAIEGIVLSQYRFAKYITTQQNNGLLERLTVCAANAAEQQRFRSVVDYTRILCEGVFLTRDLANAPPNEIYPETLAERAREVGNQAGFNVRVLNKAQIERLGMGGLLGVNRGSARPPVFIIMEYWGTRRSQPPIVLVGKGITFDTGGISLKPAANMSEMKADMHGAASVIGALSVVARLRLPLNVVGLVPATENMPSGSAMVPGDILRFLNGKTAEIENTDAEGRLILADALVYAERYKPQAVIDLATLTGACVVALGNVAAGLFGNHRELLERIKQAAERTYERVWELPLYEEYGELIRSDVADVKNSGGRNAGAITAALFLKHFVGDYPWAHLDIAGTAIAPKETDYMPKGGTGFGVRLLVDLLRTWPPLSSEGPTDKTSKTQRSERVLQ